MFKTKRKIHNTLWKCFKLIIQVEKNQTVLNSLIEREDNYFLKPIRRDIVIHSLSLSKKVNNKSVVGISKRKARDNIEYL